MSLALPRPRAALLLVVLALAAAPPVAHAGAKVAVKQLAQARVDAAAKAYASAEARRAAGTGTVDAVGAWSARWFDAQRDQPLKGKALAAAAAAHLDRMQALEAAVKQAITTGTATSADLDVAAYFVAEAELWAARARAKP